MGPPPFEPPSFGAPASGAPPPDPSSAGPPKISPFFPSPAPFSLFFSLSGGFLVEFWWCLKRRCQLCTFGLTCCRVKPRCKTTRTILQKICPPLPKKSKTKNCKFHKIQKKLRTQPKFHLQDPHLLALTFSGLFVCAVVLLLILLLDAGFSCCVLLFLLFVLLLLPLLRVTVVLGVAFVAPASCSVAAVCVALFLFLLRCCCCFCGCFQVADS